MEREVLQISGNKNCFFLMLLPSILKCFFSPLCGVYSQPSVCASLDSLTLGNDVMQQQLDSISQEKRKHPAFFGRGKKAAALALC